MLVLSLDKSLYDNYLVLVAIASHRRFHQIIYLYETKTVWERQSVGTIATFTSPSLPKLKVTSPSPKVMSPSP